MTSVPTPTDVWFLTPPGVTSVPPAPSADTAPATIPANSAPVDASFDPANVDTAQIFDVILPQTPTTAVYLKSRNSGNLLPTNTTRHNIKAALRCVCIILLSRYDLTPKFTNTTLATKTPLALYRLKAPLNCASAAYTLSSAAVELIRKYSIAATVASFTLLGQTASLTGPAVKTLTAIGGQFYVNRELQVLLLSHFDSELDEQTGNTVGYNWRGTTSPAIVANSKFGGGAVQCDNTFYSDLYLYTYLNSVIVPQDIPVWTLEAWTYITSSDSTCPLGFTADGNPDGIGYLIWLSSYEDAGSNFAILSFDYFNGSVYETMLYGEVPVSTVTGWCHVALCFTGTAYRIYLNGSIVADYTTGETEIPFKHTVGNVQNPINVKSPLVFGEPPLTIGGVLGWGAYDTIVDEVRLVEGLVSNTGTFPVPTEAYTTEALGVIDTKLSKLYSSNLSVGVFTLTGQSVDLPSPTKVTKAVVGTFTLVGQTTALSKTSSVMSAVTGVYTLQGGDTSDIPSYIGYTNGATTTVDLNIAWPSGYAAGDLGVIITESSSTNASSRAITPPYGWSLLTGWPLDDTTSYCSIFYKIASSSESNVFLHRIADHQIAVLSVFRGVDPDNPFVTAEGSVTSVAGSAVTYPSVTGVIPRTLLVECRTNSQDTTTTETDSGRTNANSAWSDLGLIRAYNTGNGDGGGITIYQAKTSAQISSGLPGTTATSTRSVGLRTLGTLVLRPKGWLPLVLTPIIAEVGAYNVNGQAIGLYKHVRLSANAVAYTLTGSDVYLGAPPIIFPAAEGAYTLTGQAAGSTYTRGISAAAGSFTTSGKAANLLDPSATAYVAAVETADTQDLEFEVVTAINTFIKGCKSDGIWAAIKASCIMAGARTLAGALTPLVGTAPTNNNFVAGDYNRKTGLVGDGSTKYLDSNRAGNADPQDSQHISTYATVSGTTAELIEIGAVNGSGTSQIGRTLSETQSIFVINRINSGVPRIAVNLAATTGFRGASRPSSSTINARANSANFVQSESSVASGTATFSVFKRGGSTYGITNCRLSFYSIGESLDLALLDSRVTTLMADIAAAIP